MAILGLLLLGLGIGQRTLWLPPATLTAGVADSVAPAPVTVISPELLETRDGAFTMSIKAEGPIQLAVGQQRDVTGWVADAAHTSVTGVDEKFSALTAESVAGTATVPNPAGSDLWVSEESATGELTYTWEAPGHGDWALLISSDGTAPAPLDISLTTANDATTPWAVPLMVIGSVLLVVAALLLLIRPRRRPQPTAGRRTAGRVPNDPATGAMEVEKIIAARDQANQNAASDHRTIAEMQQAARAASAGTPDEAPAPVLPVSDATTSLPTGTYAIPLVPTAQEQPAPASDTDEHDDENTPAGGGGGSAATSAHPIVPSAAEGQAATGQDAKDTGKSSFAVRRRVAATLAAVLLAGGAAPAVADDATSAPVETPASSAPVEASSAPVETPAAQAGLPTLLENQVQRIVANVATVVTAGDSAKNAAELAPRVAGQALVTRTANYKIRSTVEAELAPEPVNSSRLLARVVSTSDTWPRTTMVVTQGDNNQLPQLLTLVQESAREAYKLVSVSPLLPGQTFPAVDKEGSESVALDDAEGLLMSPQAAVDALAAMLVTADSPSKASFADSVYTASVAAYQSEALEKSKDATVVFTHTANGGPTKALRTADGGAIVVAGYTFGVDSTPTKDATINVPNPGAAALAGGESSTTGIVLSYSEPIVFYIPPTAGAQITILSGTRELIAAAFK